MSELRAGRQNEALRTGRPTAGRPGPHFRVAALLLSLLAAGQALAGVVAIPMRPPAETRPATPALPDDYPELIDPRWLPPPLPAPSPQAPAEQPLIFRGPGPWGLQFETTATRTRQESCIRRDNSGRFMGWMDYQHCVFSGRTLSTARWLDDFFGDWHDDEATALVTVISKTQIVEGEGVEPRLTVRASANLPNAKRRLRLVVTEEADDVVPPGLGAPVSERETENTLSAALRWMGQDRAGIQSDFDLGVRGIDPPDVFVRARGRRGWSLTREALLRFSQTLRYGSDTEERSISQLDLERVFGETTVLRLGNIYDYAAETNADGFRWTHGLSFSRILEHKRSLSAGFNVQGVTQPNWRSENFGPWLIYRRSFLRSWLFFEVEPRYTWFREDGWDGQVSAEVRLEMQVGVRK